MRLHASCQTLFYMKQNRSIFVVSFNVFTRNACFVLQPQCNANLIFHYTRCITPNRVTSRWGPSSCHCDRAKQLFWMKCRSGGEPLATLYLIWPATQIHQRRIAPLHRPVENENNFFFLLGKVFCVQKIRLGNALPGQHISELYPFIWQFDLLPLRLAMLPEP